MTEPAPSLAAYERLKALEERYLLATYARIPLVAERGEGAYLYDAEDHRYLDFISGIGVNALGYAHPRIVRVIREQAERLIHSSNLYYHRYQAELAQRLAQLSGMERAFFTNSGTEAIEGAIKLARLYTRSKSPEKIEIIALENSFHGRTAGALSITAQAKYREPFGPLLPGVHFVPHGDADNLAASVGPKTCAIVIEPIQGEGGIYEAEPAYLASAAKLARQHDAVLIFDEIQCGLGRTGKWFGYQWTTVTPDIVVVAKPLAAGLPLGCILARGPVADGFTPGLHGTTFGGGPLACRVALEFLAVMEDEHLIERVQHMGSELREALRGLMKKHSSIRAVRGRGLMLALDLDRPSKPLVNAAREKRLLINSTHDTVVRLLPPYIINSDHVREAVQILDGLLPGA